MRDVILTVLNRCGGARIGYFDEHKIGQLIREYDRGKFWYYDILMKVFNMCVWYDQFVANKPNMIVT